jgi:YVTN family beta-propeller protein
MRLFAAFAIIGSISLSLGATFGTVVMIDGGVSDLVLDKSRGRLYLVNSPQNRIEIYDIARKQLLSPVSTGGQPLSVALSLDGQSLYVTDYGASTLDIINLNSLMTATRVSLSSAPEGVAVRRARADRRRNYFEHKQSLTLRSRLRQREIGIGCAAPTTATA